MGKLLMEFTCKPNAQIADMPSQECNVYISERPASFLDLKTAISPKTPAARAIRCNKRWTTFAELLFPGTDLYVMIAVASIIVEQIITITESSYGITWTIAKIWEYKLSTVLIISITL